MSVVSSKDVVARTFVAMGPSVAVPPSVELRAELAARNAEFEDATAEQILGWAVERFGDRLTMATAFGPEGMVILHLLSRVGPQVSVFNLDTGYQFEQTLQLRERVRERYGIDVVSKCPRQTVAEYEAANGGPVYLHDPDRCCRERKIQVLQDAIAGKEAWITAIRRDQSPDRARAEIVGWDKRFQLVKINPLANWSRNDVWKLITDHDIPYNPLHDQGYTSIGCWPCTRSVTFGEDERAGRWSGTAKTECGLHSS
jgi:phosphoadenosine phosphosulfate reductase